MRYLQKRMPILAPFQIRKSNVVYDLSSRFTGIQSPEMLISRKSAGEKLAFPRHLLPMRTSLCVWICRGFRPCAVHFSCKTPVAIRTAGVLQAHQFTKSASTIKGYDAPASSLSSSILSPNGAGLPKSLGVSRYCSIQPVSKAAETAAPSAWLSRLAAVRAIVSA